MSAPPAHVSRPRRQPAIIQVEPEIGPNWFLEVFENEAGVWTSSEIRSDDFHLPTYPTGMGAVDDSGGLHVVFLDVDRRVMYGRRTESDWEFTPVDLVGSGGVPGFAVDPWGAAHLSYRTSLPSSRYATNACGAWRIYDVGEDGPVGPLAIQPDGRLSIAFARETPDASLWFATSDR